MRPIFLGLLLLGGGCNPPNLVNVENPPQAAGALRGSAALELVAIDPSRWPQKVMVGRTNDWRLVGPRSHWRVDLTPWSTSPAPLWLSPLHPDQVFHDMRWHPGDASRLALVPHHRLGGSVYREAVDLLLEHLAPLTGSRVHLWHRDELRVWLPPSGSSPDYEAACRSAMEAWNEALGRTRFVVAAQADAADVVCTLSEETRLAYTEVAERHDDGRLVRVRVHLSPRWAAGADAYVRRAYLHELGHAQGLWGHSRERFYILNGQAVVTDAIHPHEALVARWMWNLPEGFDFAWIDRATVVRQNPERYPISRCELGMAGGTGEFRRASPGGN